MRGAARCRTVPGKVCEERGERLGGERTNFLSPSSPQLKKKSFKKIEKQQQQRTRARFLLTSTSEVYGDPLEHPQTEAYWGNVNPIGERSCYDEGKRAAECLTFDYRREHGLEVRVCRIFNTYGPRMALDDGRVVSNFVAQALTDQPMTVYGDGQQTRSFQYVSDLVAGMVAVMEGERYVLAFFGVFWSSDSCCPRRRLSGGPGFGGGGPRKEGEKRKTHLLFSFRLFLSNLKNSKKRTPHDFLTYPHLPGEETGPFNIGNPVEFTMLELAQVVKEVVNPKAEIVFRENTADDPSRRKPDISKAKKILGWEPKVPLREGLKFMVKDFATRLRVEVPEGAQVA